MGDILFHLPFRYQDRTRITPIRDIRPNDWCVVAGRVINTEIIIGKKPVCICHVEDNTGILTLRFFYFNKQQVAAIKKAKKICVFGEVREYKQQLEIVHPEYQLLDDEVDLKVEENYTPIYPTTQGLTQKKLRQLVKYIFETYTAELQQLEWMTEKELFDHGFYTLSESLSILHNPPPDTLLSSLETGAHPAIKRVIFDELLAHQISMQSARKNRSALQAPSITFQTQVHEQFITSLPFALTDAQKRVSMEVINDLASQKPMLRLVQGDVGAGKTIIAAISALQVIGEGFQVAFMAPTDLLSEQHATNFKGWLEPFDIVIKRLSGKMKASEKKEVLHALETNKCQLIIGTHALFQEQVVFHRLGFIIIDEQHRFGVEQRYALQKKGIQQSLVPHQLLMTATPIPRTLSMSHFAHLDLSIIDELPKGRTPVITALINQNKREEIIKRLESAINEGRQVYWVCTLIEESESLQCVAATQTASYLQEQLPTARIGLIHGRLKAEEKDHIMEAFRKGELDLLVATTVIEVGVDVPKASLMIIENAERLGLSQLHQLRGRVGRGDTQSHCLLLYQAPLSLQSTERLTLMRATTDGFVISEKDLEMRGAGEVLGTKQTGYKSFKIADLQRDKHLFPALARLSHQLVHEQQDIAKNISLRWLGHFEHFIQS